MPRSSGFKCHIGSNREAKIFAKGKFELYTLSKNFIIVPLLILQTTIFSGLALPAQSSEAIDVQQFRAIGDGITDDTAAIQSAFDHLQRNGGILRFSQGRTYLISNQISISAAGNFSIEGNGATIKMADGVAVTSGKVMLLFQSSSYFGVKDLTIDGNRGTRDPAEVWAHNVVLKGSTNFTFENVASINGVVDGFYLEPLDQTDPSTYTTDGVFINAFADNNFRQGMSIINAENIQILGGTFSNTNGTAPAAGIDIEPNRGSASPGVSNVLFDGVTFSGNDGFGLILSHKGFVENITVTNSEFTDNDLGGINLKSADTVIDGNIFHGFTDSMRGIIDAGGTPHKSSSNNKIIGNKFYEIHTGKAVIYFHKAAGINNYLFGNEFSNFDGPAIVVAREGSVDVIDNNEKPLILP